MDEILNPLDDHCGMQITLLAMLKVFMWLGSQDKIHKIIIFVMAHYVFPFSIECLVRDLWNVSIFNVEPVDY